MLQAPSQFSVNQWLQQDVDTLLTWIDQQRSLIDNSLSLSLIDGLILRVDYFLSERNYKLSSQWATLTFKLCDHLLQNDSCSDRDFLLIKVMMLRVRLIQTFGEQNNHPILDPNIIVQWFKQTCNLSLDEVCTMAKNWRNYPVEKIRRLRQLKNRLRVLVQLSQVSQSLAHFPDLEPWLTIQSQLP
jgi:hypothetical protein